MPETTGDGTYGDSGGASRFFPIFKYTAKASSDERPTADGVAHPTVKAVELMRWLVKLVTPPHAAPTYGSPPPSGRRAVYSLWPRRR